MPEPSSSPHDASGFPAMDDRTPEARERLQRQLRASYGVRTAEEELLLERVVDLTWRLRGTALMLGAKATLSRLDGAAFAPVSKSYTSPALDALPRLDSLQVDTLRDAVARVADLKDDIADPDLRPSWLDLQRILASLVGAERLDHGIDGFGPLRDLLQWMLWEDGLEEDEKEAARRGERLAEDPYAPQLPGHTWADVLGYLEGRLQARLDEALKMQAARRVARLESQEIPSEDDLKVVPRYERDLAKQLEQATKALREAVGRRRLGEIGRAWLRGR